LFVICVLELDSRYSNVPIRLRHYTGHYSPIDFFNVIMSNTLYISCFPKKTIPGVPILINSMTAFGRGEFRNKKGRFSVEIQSVNRKYLEITVVLPKQFTSLEPEIRNSVGTKLSRGKVNIVVDVEFNLDVVPLVKPNIGMARALLKSYHEVADALGYEGRIDFSSIIRNREVIEDVRSFESMPEFRIAIMKALSKALLEIQKMQMTEGRAIGADCIARLEIMQKSLREVKKNAVIVVDKYRRRLMERIKEITGNQPEKDERLLREVAIYADKTDITEEITRFDSHIAQFKSYMKSKESVGRTLDFLVQEMHREINTIGSKSADLMIANSVVLVKSELEKIREQVQNIA
jgi:uncharacterized protein (TIGR00255 family)